MLISDDYILMLPGFVEGESRKVVLYDVGSILDLQQADRMLEGHPSIDLPEIAWGTLDCSAQRVRRWLDKDRLVKLRANPGGSIRMTYCEPGEWRKYITEEQWQWLCQICEVSQIYCEETAIKEARSKATEESKPPGPEAQKPKKKKIKAKFRRKQRGLNYAEL